MKILIATTNPAKFKEITHDLSDLPYEFLNLKDFNLHNHDVAEPHTTLWQNAFEKASFFGNKSKVLTFAEDTGFFIPNLNNQPGVNAKHFGKTPEDCRQKVLSGLKGKTKNNRNAFFETSGCLYDPKTKNFQIFNGRMSGRITTKSVGKIQDAMIYDSIFFYPPKNNVFANLSISEKNLISQRGQVVQQLKHYLSRQYGFAQIMAPLAIVIKNRKMLLLKRRDSQPQFNGKWEYPGGGVDNGESLENCLLREVKEETGFNIQIITQLPGILTAVEKKLNYQVFLALFVTKVVAGKLRTSASESSASHWCTLSEAMAHDQMPLNKQFLRDNLTLLKQYLD